jgi:hypothetical protein
MASRIPGAAATIAPRESTANTTERARVVDVRTGYYRAERPAILLDQDALLGAHLGSVSGIGASCAALEAAFAHHPVRCLPLPAHTSELLALADEVGPDFSSSPSAANR